MSTYVFEMSMSLPLPREEVFAFFADAANLEGITPPELRFRKLSPRPIPTQDETLVGFVALAGAYHSLGVPPARFVGEQVRGPYRLWRPAHRVCDDKEGTVLEDTVRYRLRAPMPRLLEGGPDRWRLAPRPVRSPARRGAPLKPPFG